MEIFRENLINFIFLQFYKLNSEVRLLAYVSEMTFEIKINSVNLISAS
jgi:hypothetical protein